MAKPVVTVGVCFRNSEKTIKEALESLMSQHFAHNLMEVILVDDGSEDESYSIVNVHLPKMSMKVKIFRHKWNGLGYSRNVVVKNAEGEYLLWLDADMILPSDHVGRQVEFMNSNPKVGIAKARYGTHPEENWIGFLENVAYEAIDMMYGGKPTSRTLGTGGSIYRLKALKQVGGFDETIKGAGEDMDAEYRIREAGWLLFMGSPAVFYERRRKTWKDLWNEGFWHGYGIHYLYQKNGPILNLFKMCPPAGFIAGVLYSTVAYKIHHKKIIFLLPLQYTFKRIAWFFGFIRGQIDDFTRHIHKKRSPIQDSIT